MVGRIQYAATPTSAIFADFEAASWFLHIHNDDDSLAAELGLKYLQLRAFDYTRQNERITNTPYGMAALGLSCFTDC